MCSETAGFMNMNTITPIKSHIIDYNLLFYISQISSEHATEEYIRKVFYSLDIGIVSSVEFEEDETTQFYKNSNKTALVFMERWFNNNSVEHLQEKILNNKNIEARIVHDDPQYWVLHKNERSLYTRINSLEQQNIELKTTVDGNKNTIKELKRLINQHDTNISYLSSKLNSNVVQSSPIETQTQTPENCQVTFDEVWKRRLRTRQ